MTASAKGEKGAEVCLILHWLFLQRPLPFIFFLIIYWKPTYEALCKALGIQWWGRHSPALKELTFYRWTGKFSTVIIQRNKCDDIGTHGILWNHSVISNSAQEKSKESWAWKSEQVLVEWQCSQWQRRTLCAKSTCKRAEVGKHLSGASADGEQLIRSKGQRLCASWDRGGRRGEQGQMIKGSGCHANHLHCPEVGRKPLEIFKQGSDVLRFSI